MKNTMFLSEIIASQLYWIKIMSLLNCNGIFKIKGQLRLDRK